MSSKKVYSIPIVIDWLQLYCDGSNFTPHSDYIWEKQPFQTKHFKTQYKIIYRNEEFATIQADPTSNILPVGSMIVKFSNRELYGQNLSGLVNCFLSDNNILYRSITRVDIAVDFWRFSTGDFPEQFIRNFMSCKYLKNGRGKYAIFGEQQFKHTFDYLRFGTKQSDVNVYMYNKTKELEQVKDKPYIRKLWKEYFGETSKNIWRLEFSLKGKSTNFVDLDTGETYIIDLSILEDNELKKRIFYSLLAQYFEFVKNDGTKNKSRMDKLTLFERVDIQFKPLYLPKAPCSSKSDKVFIKKLFMLDQELRNVPIEIQMAQTQLFNDYAVRVGLTDFVEKKIHEWQTLHHRP